MKFTTDKKDSTIQQAYLSRLQQLFERSREEFQRLAEYFPFVVSIWSKDGQSCIYVNQVVEEVLQVDRKKLLDKGTPVIQEVTHPGNLDYLASVMQKLEVAEGAVTLRAYHYIRSCYPPHGYRWFLSHTKRMRSGEYMRLYFCLKDILPVNRHIESLLCELCLSKDNLDRFEPHCSRKGSAATHQ